MLILIFLKMLAYKSIDIEASQIKSEQLVFPGFIELRTMEKTVPLLIWYYLKNNLDIDQDYVYISCAHRLSHNNPRHTHQHRPIIVNFRDNSNVQTIMNNVQRLRYTTFYTDFDFSCEIQEAQGRLWSRYKQFKGQIWAGIKPGNVRKKLSWLNAHIMHSTFIAKCKTEISGRRR
jgi:hypothetical protein